ncbi:MAG: hypothetical protein KAU29_12415 [Gammaproteobacteria bacterium]|nr:hypothetical protein [Gammaproteobacteria bacterium]
MLNHARVKFYFLLVLIVPFFLSGCDSGKKAEQKVSYSQDIIPILQRHCMECHVNNGSGQKASGLDMSTHQAFMKGTKFGPVVKAGDSLSSTLVLLVEGKADPSIKMPHGDREALSAAEIKTLRQWIDQGAANN